MQKGFKIMALTLVLLAGAFMGDDVKSDRNGTNTPTLAELQSGERSLVVGGVADFGRFNFDETGQVRQGDTRQMGMDREIVRALAQRLGIKRIEFMTMDFGELEGALLGGQIDLIANNYWITPERQQKMLFAQPHYSGGGIWRASPIAR